MQESTFYLSRDEFFLFHSAIEKECDRRLKGEGKDGLNRENEQCYYGFHQCEPDPEDEYSHQSVKHVILSCLQDELKSNRRKYGFRLDKSERIKFDGRYLYNLKNDYNGGKEKIEVQKKYYLAFLKLLEVENLKALKDKFIAENGEPALKDREECIRPAHTSRCPGQEEDQEEDASAKPQENNSSRKMDDVLGQRLRKLENTYWYFYRYNFKKLKNEPHGIFRMVLRFGKMLSNGDIEVSLITGSKIFADYSGWIIKRESNPSILVCRLTTKDSSAKLKVLMFHIDPRIKSQVYLGQYLEYDDTYSLMSGTVVIEKIKDTSNLDLSSKIFTYGTPEMLEQVDENIRYYFEEKNLNFTKSPTGISTSYDFERWLEEKREERLKSQPSKVHDLYIAVPFAEMQGELEQLQKLEEIIYQMLKDPILKQIGIDSSTIHHRTVEKNQLLEPGFLLKREQQVINRSKAFFFVFPQTEKILTSVFIQAGYAIHSGLPTFIFYRDLKYLPYSLQASRELDHVKMRQIKSLEQILHFPEWVKVNEYYKLYGRQ